MAPTKASQLVQPSAPLKIKRTLFNAGISQAELAREISIPTSTLAQIINHNVWPGNQDRSQIREKIKAFLQSRGVNCELGVLWEFDDRDDPVTYLGILAKAAAAAPPESKRKADYIHDDLPENAMLSQKSKQHFKLFRDPFTDDVTCPEDVFMAPDQQYVRTAMYQTCKHGGFIAVVGESGAGKTTLRRDLQDKINREDPNIRIVFPRIIDKSRINASSICDAILADMGVTPKSSLEAKARQIETLLADSSRAGNSHVLMIEESHDISIQTLKFMKRFWELEDGFKKLIAIVLVGQPELKDTLNEHKHPEIREVARRCEIIELHPLGENLQSYLELKFKRMNRPLADIFEPDAFDAIRARLTVHKGTSRTPVNMAYPLIVNNLVTVAMNACVEIGEQKISAELVRGL